MELRNLGTSGLRVSAVGLGCNNFGVRLDSEASRAGSDTAIDAGITFFDPADMYGGRGGSETVMGEILGARRKDIVLATKFGMAMDDEGVKKGASRRYIMSAVDASLTRLKTDWIDLYQLHRPDPLTPIEETLRALEDLMRDGKVRYIGCSNLPAWQVVDAHWTALKTGSFPFVSCQDEYSLVVREIENELIPATQHYGMGLLPFFPLACGLLTGKYRKGEAMPEGARITSAKRHADRYLTTRNWQIVEGLRAYAEQRGHTLLELAFSWLACREPVSSVIAGAMKPEQVRQNVTAINWDLTNEDLAAIDQICGIEAGI